MTNPPSWKLHGAIGHCSRLDGPLIALARTALETGNANHVLPWVNREDEEEIRRAFDHAVAVRQLGPQAKELADRHFFETLVRVHRAAEGSPYTGLQPAGPEPGPAPLADKALETGLVKDLVTLLIDAVRSGVHRHYQDAMSRKSFPVDDVAAGRRYVAAYEPYVQYVEGLWRAATGSASDHHPDLADRGLIDPCQSRHPPAP